MTSSAAVEELSTASPHCQALKDLHAELDGQGLFAHTHFWRWKLLIWVPTFFASYLGLLVVPPGPLWLLLVPLVAMAILTMGYVGHDAGHYALSKKPWINDVWGHFGMTFLCGFSFGFWRARHNNHHVHCQEVSGDPDMSTRVRRTGRRPSAAASSESRSGRSGRWRRFTGSRFVGTDCAISSSSRSARASIGS
jgi:fatty acid desaturase